MPHGVSEVSKEYWEILILQGLVKSGKVSAEAGNYYFPDSTLIDQLQDEGLIFHDTYIDCWKPAPDSLEKLKVMLAGRMT